MATLIIENSQKIASLRFTATAFASLSTGKAKNMFAENSTDMKVNAT